MDRIVSLVAISLVVGFLVGAGIFMLVPEDQNVLVRTIIKEPVVLSISDDVMADIEKVGTKQFDSYDSLVNFLKLKSSGSGSDDSGVNFDGGGILEGAIDSVSTPAVSRVESKVSSDEGTDYSKTNVQVEGVDEPDIVKTDGEYIYSVSDGRVIVSRAFPASEMEILSVINFNEKIGASLKGGFAPVPISGSTNVRNLFVNGDKLVVFLNRYSYKPYSQLRCLGQDYCGGVSESFSVVNIYDLSDKKSLTLERVVEADGDYVDARMIGDFVYFVTNKNVNEKNPILPVYFVDGLMREVSLDDLYYLGDDDDNYVFSSVASINVIDGEFSSESYLVGYTSTIYASDKNIYLTSAKYRNYNDYQVEIINNAVLHLLPRSVASEVSAILKDDKYSYNKFSRVGEIVEGYYESLEGEEKEAFNKSVIMSISEYKMKTEKDRVRTIIHKIRIEDGEVEHQVSGEVPGSVLDQFSMDEHEGYFRIATTTGQNWWWGGSRTNSSNHVYVLDETLDIVGAIEDLAEGERIFSSRFMEERLYLVTFRQVDPLFVIDLSVPEEPEVLGYLKIAGVSEYLHPFDEDHIIGIGRDATEEGRMQGIKLSLFDVSDVNNPKEKDKFLIGERGSSSEVFNDHKALLFDYEKKLMVIPVGEARAEYSNYWSGVYVLNIDRSGFSLRGKVSHDGSTENRHYSYESVIRRSLYIDDTLYTVSNFKILANDLESLDEVGGIEIDRVKHDEPVVYMAEDVAVARAEVI